MPVKRGRADQIINRLASRLMGSTSHISLMTGFQVVTDMPIQMQPGTIQRAGLAKVRAPLFFLFQGPDRIRSSATAR